MSSVSEIVQDSKLRSMSAAGGDTGDQMADLLNWNNLTYKMPVTNSVVSARNIKKYPADRNSYSWGLGGTGSAGPIFFHLQAGEQYVDWGKSFLEITLEHDPRCAETVWLNYGLGSICNFIETVIVTTRSGTEIHRIEQFNRWRALQDRLHEKSAWFKQIGSMMGYTSDEKFTRLQMCDKFNDQVSFTEFCPDEVATAGKASNFENVQSKTFLLPMDRLGGPFATGQLSPAVLAGGLIIELRLGSYLNSFTGLKLDGSVPVFTSVSTAIAGTSSSTTITDLEPLGYEFRMVFSNFSPSANLAVGDRILFTKDERKLFGDTVYTIESISTSTDSMTLSPIFPQFSGRVTSGLPYAITTGWDWVQVDEAQLDTETAIQGYSSESLTHSSTTAPKLKDIFVHLDTHLLNDAAMRSLTQIAASEGLELVYEGAFHQQSAALTARSDIVCSKAVSRALRVYGAYYQPPSAALNTDICRPVYGAEKYQWRLGSIYFPNQVLDKKITQYHNLQYVLEHIDDPKSHNMFTPTAFKKVLPILAATFERSALLKYSGSAINNSRTLSLLAEASSDDVTDHPTAQFHFWLEHLVVAKTFLNNCIVSI